MFSVMSCSFTDLALLEILSFFPSVLFELPKLKNKDEFFSPSDPQSLKDKLIQERKGKKKKERAYIRKESIHGLVKYIRKI